jgi:hypothetical protein
MTLDRDLLIKLLNLTGSENDAEALNAIRRSNALLRRHQAPWSDLLALPQEPAQVRQHGPAKARQQRPRPRPTGSHAFREEPIWERKVRPGARQTYRATNAANQGQFSHIRSESTTLRVLFFPITVFDWLYVGVVYTKRAWPKSVAMIVPILGGGAAAMIWAFMLLGVVQLIGTALE